MTPETVEQFLARGGQIEMVAQGESGIPGALFPHVASANSPSKDVFKSIARSRARAGRAAAVSRASRRNPYGRSKPPPAGPGRPKA